MSHSHPRHSSEPALGSSHEQMDELLGSFDHVRSIRDPIAQRLAMGREAGRLDLDADHYSELYQLYERGWRARRRRVERWLHRIVDWCEQQSFFSVLEYIGRLAILVAIGSFFVELPERRAMREGEAWETIQAAEGEAWSGHRRAAIERLDAACIALEGLAAPAAQLEGLRLDRCRGPWDGLLSGTWISRWLEPRGAVLVGANFHRTDLAHAILPNADLSQAALDGADLRQAQLAGARLVGARLVGANLFRADLSGADLTGADLTGADLTRARLTGAVLDGAILDRGQLVFSDLRRANANEASFRSANLAAARLDDANLLGADLAGATLSRLRINGGAVFDHAHLAGARIQDGVLSHSQLNAMESQPTWIPTNVSPGTRIGLLLPSDLDFFDHVAAGARATAERLGMKLQIIVLDQLQFSIQGYAAVMPGLGILTDSTGVITERLATEQLLHDGIDMLILDPIDETRSEHTVERAFRAGARIICIDHCTSPEAAARWVSATYTTDQTAMGYDIGRYTARWLGKRRQRPDAPWRVGILRDCEFLDCFHRVEGFRAALDDSGVPWQETFYRRVHFNENTSKVARQVLGQHQSVEILWSPNESGTDRLIEAVIDLGLSRQVDVFASDWSQRVAAEMARPAEERLVHATVVQNPFAMGEAAVQSAFDEWNGAAPSFAVHMLDHHVIDRADQHETRTAAGG